MAKAGVPRPVMGSQPARAEKPLKKALASASRCPSRRTRNKSVLGAATRVSLKAAQPEALYRKGFRNSSTGLPAATSWSFRREMMDATRIFPADSGDPSLLCLYFTRAP